MVEFVLFEPAFPRSLLYCLRAAADLLRRIWSTGESVGRASTGRLSALISWLEAQIDEFDLAHMHTVITRVVDDTARVCSHIAQEIQGPPAAGADAPAEDGVSANEEAAEEARAASVQVQAQG